MLFAIVVAAGRGLRMGFKKQFFSLAGQPMWTRSVQAMLAGGAEQVVVVASAEDVDAMSESMANCQWADRCVVAVGGDTRHQSVVAGMRHIYEQVTSLEVDLRDVLVGVHDAARPFVCAEDVSNTYACARAEGVAILGTGCKDTVKWYDGAYVDHTVPREQLFLAQTPQVIRGDIVYRAYLTDSSPQSPTDDSALMESLGYRVACVESTHYNGKVTTPADLDYARWLASKLWGEEKL
ncbi:IspD/TarI family cytidylyltransferase [Alicyclobacillus fastidiosus]|uniref:IspD/TarI family cytidylyltransferase n=1 Tax=Alicyclobacillus fastidiosus TaxID=392011 RepID=A0ABV5AIU2_9BACL|nr:IspD/TarI family cytidylyltransferase [Alicyclobacillus fastidiosus]WEH09970.1 IspD/TarI family cytidylyltransferase [Alicyclobacillus fastidiosus]